MRALVGTGSMQSQQEALQLFHHAATQTSGNNSNGNKKGKDAGKGPGLTQRHLDGDGQVHLRD